jgi:DNA-binding transcriptional LysR family regulator
MDLRHLRYFLAVAEEGHFGRAAERLHIVQPALSMQIRALEEELGTPLLLRTSRRVELTQAGTLLRVEAERTIAQAARAKSVVQRAARGEIGNVRIAFTGGAAFAGKLSADLRAFHKIFPDVELELKEMPASQHPEAILDDRIDIAYCPAHESKFDARLTVDSIGSWPWMIAMVEDHPLAAETAIPTAALWDQRFILFATHARDEVQLNVLRRVLGREPCVAHRVTNTISVLAMAAAGLGLAFLPGSMGGVRIQNIQYRPLADFDIPAGLVLLSRAGEASGAVGAFVAVACARSVSTSSAAALR